MAGQCTKRQLVNSLESQSGDWIKATGKGLLGPGLRDLEAERLGYNDRWRR
jgi:hypothetical protein